MQLTTATKITLVRMFLVPFVAIGILYHRYNLALILFFISGLTDLLDGLVARKLGQKTKVGALLDPMADKLLLSTSFLLLALPASNLPVSIPIWLAVLVFGRDLIIVISSVAIALTTGFTKFDPSIFGKASTALQIVCVLAVLLVNDFGIDRIWINWLFYLTFGLTLFSGLHYIYVFTKRYNLETPHDTKPKE
jgi:cardiolipin synthase (CMP-forming)